MSITNSDTGFFTCIPSISPADFALPAAGNLVISDVNILNDGTIAYLCPLVLMSWSEVSDTWLILATETPETPIIPLKKGDVISFCGMLVFRRRTRKVTLYANSANVKPYRVNVQETEEVGEPLKSSNASDESSGLKRSYDLVVPDLGIITCSFTGRISQAVKGSRGAFWVIDILSPIPSDREKVCVGIECAADRVEEVLKRFPLGLHGHFSGIFKSYGNALNADIPEFKLDTAVFNGRTDGSPQGMIGQTDTRSREKTSRRRQQDPKPSATPTMKPKGVTDKSPKEESSRITKGGKRALGEDTEGSEAPKRARGEPEDVTSWYIRPKPDGLQSSPEAGSSKGGSSKGMKSTATPLRFQTGSARNAPAISAVENTPRIVAVPLELVPPRSGGRSTAPSKGKEKSTVTPARTLGAKEKAASSSARPSSSGNRQS
ncbi:hypothetical protein FRC05_005945 [Tulasnella sp. 425]|nr:hypothetical protein FRC05_005945 [Tulasnella sp. 425]